jgi:cytochrome c peroxidase
MVFSFFSCSSDENSATNSSNGTITDTPVTFNFSSILNIDFNNLFNYDNQYIPIYINKDHTNGATISNEVATLGRVLFYDNKLSSDNSTSCASCHKQAFAFGDDNTVSIGANGVTERHSMRLVNVRFSDEGKFFWDERATSLEIQTTMPIKDETEMGFSGINGQPNFNDLITKLEETEYYPSLFEFAFNSAEITELKIQTALTQFIKSIQSFDSKFDQGRINTNNNGQVFTNYTAEENQGKDLFLRPPTFNNQGERVNGGIGCASCHQAPEFSINPNVLNNGIISTISGIGADQDITRSPTLRDIVKSNGSANGAFMHNALSVNLETILDHYDAISTDGNTNLDPRLTPGGNPQQLQLTSLEKQAVISFIKTLSGTDVYTNEKWSNPFIN